MCTFFEKAHDRETNDTFTAAGSQDHSIRATDLLHDTSSAPRPGQTLFDEVARHVADAPGIFRSGESQFDRFAHTELGLLPGYVTFELVNHKLLIRDDRFD